jgi:hypothetical protein
MAVGFIFYRRAFTILDEEVDEQSLETRSFWPSFSLAIEVLHFTIKPLIHINSFFLISPLDQLQIGPLDFSVIYKMIIGFQFNQIGL